MQWAASSYSRVRRSPPCNTGFMPVRQQRSPSDTDAPDRTTGELYCRLPQDSPMNVRGVRNIPCEADPADQGRTQRDGDLNPPRIGEDVVPVDRHLAASHSSWPSSVIRSVRRITRAARTPRRAFANARFTAESVSNIS